MVTALHVILFAVLLAGEALHWRRIGFASDLAFHHPRRARVITLGLGLARLTAFGLVLLGLHQLQETSVRPPRPTSGRNRLIIVLDFSRSMFLPDAGPRHDQLRRTRANELVLQALDAYAGPDLRVSVIGFADETARIIVDTWDLEIVRRLFRGHGIPLQHRFNPAATTDLTAGIADACDLASNWRESAIGLVVVSDGDTLSSTRNWQVPGNVLRRCVLGVGSPEGVWMAGPQAVSRQQYGDLRHLAQRLGGTYFDGNELDPPPRFWRAHAGPGFYSSLRLAETRPHALLASGLIAWLAIPLVCRSLLNRWLPAPRGCPWDSIPA